MKQFQSSLKKAVHIFYEHSLVLYFVLTRDLKGDLSLPSYKTFLWLGK